jgi:sterol O-acyltransferase
MKQHSYAFYTGWLSTEYLRRQRLQVELSELSDDGTTLSRVSSVVEERERLIHEIESSEQDLTGKFLGEMQYPNNLTFANFLDYMLCPTLVYELEYPRTDKYVPLWSMLICRIRLSYLFEKASATFGSIGLMIIITEQYVLPVIQPILPAQTVGMTFLQKVGELGWVLLDMSFPYIHCLSHLTLVS